MAPTAAAVVVPQGTGNARNRFGDEQQTRRMWVCRVVKR